MNDYQYNLVKELSFIRYGGTDEELRAANILLREIKAAGGEGELMDFNVKAFDLEKCSMRVVAPFEREIETIPFGCSGSLPEGGKDLKLYYAPRGVEDEFIGMDDLSDTAVVMNALDINNYKLLCKKNAAAFIIIVGKYYESMHDSNAYSRNVRERFLEFGQIPGFMVTAHDMTDMIRDGAETVHLELRQTDKLNVSRDVLAVIPGKELPGESIVLTAHYDSVPLGTGSWDNATGAATLMYIYRYFMKNAPRRTMRFVWCGSEEQGLLGSKAYVEQKPEIIPEIKFCFNFDMCGTVLGPNLIFITGGKELETFVDLFCKHEGYSAQYRTTVHSSDSAPFCDKGIPAIGLSRGTKTSDIHTHHDLLFPVSAQALVNNGDFFIKMIEYVTNSVILPAPVGMPDDMLKALDKYFQRDVK